MNARRTFYIKSYNISGYTMQLDEMIAFQKIIYTYYDTYCRDLPWRKTTNPYNILISEVMLQQTQVDRVIEKYEKFIINFSTFHTLAQASFSDILFYWQGLGYNRRALYLQRIAQKVVAEYQGILPRTVEELKKFPGLGLATASSIVVFSYNIPLVFIETNIRTVYIHYFFHGKKEIHDEEIIPFIDTTLDRKNPRKWYNALMDYGAMLKRTEGNLSKKSAHYTKQSPFKGSNREVRGKILRFLVTKKTITTEELSSLFVHDGHKLHKAVDQLTGEGFIEQTGSEIRLI
ncbi:A/G-specific adenine glycosylase [Chlamydiota bacterium]